MDTKPEGWRARAWEGGCVLPPFSKIHMTFRLLGPGPVAFWRSPCALSQQLAKKEVMCQPNSSSTFSLGLRLGPLGRQASSLSSLHQPNLGYRVSTFSPA